MDVEKVAHRAERKINSKVKAATEEAAREIASSVEGIIKDEMFQEEWIKEGHLRQRVFNGASKFREAEKKREEEIKKKVLAAATILREKTEEEGREVKKKVLAAAKILREKMEEEVRKKMDVEDVDRYEDMDPLKKAAWDKFLRLADKEPSLLDKLIGSAVRVQRAKPREIPLGEGLVSPKVAKSSRLEADLIAADAKAEVRHKLQDFDSEGEAAYVRSIA